MARAAVRAKQAQQAQAQAAAKPSRKQRKHASGGNPNQDLFFSRLRRKQKWVFLALAIIFAVTFVALGVGSGGGAGLDQIYNGLLGGGDDAVGKAKNLIKTDPKKGYQDLAAAYIVKNDLPSAITAMQQYLALKKTDSNAWATLGSYEKQLGDKSAADYQQVLAAAALQTPGSIFQPGGDLTGKLGTNPIDQYYQTKNQAISGPLYQKAIDGYNGSLTDYQNAAKYAKEADRAAAWYAVVLAAQNAGQTSGKGNAALTALQNYVKYSPDTTNLKQIEAQCKLYGGTCVPAKKK